MSKLEDLQSLINNMFENAQNKNDIDNLSKAQTLINEAQNEAKKEQEEKAQLLKDYKESIKYSVASNPQNEVLGTAPSFEDILAQIIKEK